MSEINSIIMRLEGYLGTIVNSGVTGSPSTLEYQAVATWLEEMKGIMRQPGLRDQTDWEIFADGDVVNASTSSLARTGAGTLYGLLIGSIENGNAELVSILDTVNLVTADQTAADNAAMRGKLYVPAAASASFREYFGAAFPSGIAFATGLSFTADGADGTAPTANDISVVALYRTA